MKRRDFGKGLVGGAGMLGLGNAAAQPTRGPRRNTMMRVGGDYHCVVGGNIASNENLEYNLRYGVKHLTAQLRRPTTGAGWDLDELKRMRENCDKHGVTFEAIRMDPEY